MQDVRGRGWSEAIRRGTSRPHRGRHRRLALAAAAVGVALTLGACGSPAGSSASTTTRAPSSSSPGSTSPGSTEPTSGAGATAAVHAAYQVLFDLANPALAPKLAVVQDGSTLAGTMAKELGSALAKQATGATVSAVTTEPASSCSDSGLPSPCASVRYSILGKGGKALLSNSKGYAVYVGGRWLVAKETICGLLALAAGGGGEPAGC